MGAVTAVAATAIGALAGTVPAQAATSASAAPAVVKWQTVYSTHGGPAQRFESITAPVKTDAWAVGTTSLTGPGTPVFAKWNGEYWHPVAFSPSFNFEATGQTGEAFSSSPSNVWFFGENTATMAPEALVFNGKKWAAWSLPSDFGNPLAVVSPSDVWAESTETCARYTDGCTVLLHWNGTTWSRDKVPGIYPVASSAGAHAWILTMADGAPEPRQPASGEPIVYRTTGAKLANLNTPGQAEVGQDVDGIAAAPDGRVWITGGETGQPPELYSWTGRKWVSSVIPGALSVGWTNLSYDGKNGFWDGPWAHWTGSKWIDTSAVVGQLTSGGFAETAAIPGTDSAWSVGSIPRTAKSTVTNSIVGVYGPLS